MHNTLKLLTFFILPALSCTTIDRNDQDTIKRNQLFDFDWKFIQEDVSDASTVTFDDSNWRKLDLPHDWSIEGNLDKNNPSGVPGGYFPTGIGWYRKSFMVSNAWKDKRVSIYFEGVYMNSEVFVNGKSVGLHPYGYTSFYYDITPFLVFGEKNIIAVRVDNSQQVNCRWYSGSGIYRHVWLMATNPIHVAHWGVAITTPEVHQNEAMVEINTLIKNETASPQIIFLSTQLSWMNGTRTEGSDIKIELKPNDAQEIVQSISVDNPLLWSPEQPNLYQAELNIKQEGKTIDTYNKTFGIRSIEFSADRGFLLNGEQVKLNGGCVHHDNGCLGAKAFNRAEERKVELLKSAGFNAVRTSHNPPSEAFLDACDRLGLFVIDESFDGWREAKLPHAPKDYSIYFDEWSRRDVESMVLRDRNHPSIIMWSTGNEIIERTKPEAVETARKLANHVRKLDPTRPVTSALTTWGQGWERFDTLFAVHDVGGYNYQLLPYAVSDHERIPSRVMVQTESYPNDAFAVWDLVQSHEYIIGDFVWTAMDYFGESSIGRYYYPEEPEGEHYEGDFFPWHGAYCGDIDLAGWRKPISHYRDLLWNNSEQVYMAVREPNPNSGEIKLTGWAVWPTWESWTWPGHEGKDIQVEIYSKYPKVRLYLDDQLIGEKPTTREHEFKATFTVPYSPGVLKAVAVEGEEEIGSSTLTTAGPAFEIALDSDRTNILANGQDLCYITVEITDEEGTVNPIADNELIFNIEGPGEIVGVDNANLKELKNYIGNSVKAWNGRALVVIKSTQMAGEIKLSVQSPRLSTAEVTIRSIQD